MRTLPRYAAFAVCLGLTAAVAGDAEAAAVHQDQTADRLYFTYHLLQPGQTVTYALTSLSRNAAPVMHLWEFGTGEVAQDTASVTFTNGSNQIRHYYLMVRASDASSHGTAVLLRNGASMGAIPVGGVRLDVDGGFDVEHEAMAAPGGPVDLIAMGLHESGHMVDLDLSGGVGLGTKLDHPDIDEVVVGVRYGLPGPINVYSNDPLDGDGDGLGWRLELALGTCDDATMPGCASVIDPADTDRDGIPDGAEVLGIDAWPAPQYLPMYGADPLHKDVFVEVDHHDDLATLPLDEDDVLEINAIFSDGSEVDLQNPDGLPGVRVHMDIGTPCPNAVALCGDWEGSNAVPDGTSYGSAADTYRAVSRQGVFRYALMSVGGGGQAWQPGDRLGWGGNAYNPNIAAFVHELGHSVGVAHYGHVNWGASNGKPHYDSLMNYAFTYSAGKFSLGESTVVLDPSFVEEEAGLGMDASHLQGYPYYRVVGASGQVDWNFDKKYSPEPVRAPVTYASTAGSGALSTNYENIHTEPDLPAATPALVKAGDRLYAVYVDDGRMVYRFAEMNGPGSDGSCPGGGTLGDDCADWSAAVEVPTDFDVLGVSAIFEDGLMVLAYRSENNTLRVRRMLVASSGQLTLVGNGSGNEFHVANTDREPELQAVRVSPTHFGGDDHVIGIFYRGIGGEYRWETMTSAWHGWSTDRGALLDESAATIAGEHAPSFTSWPYDQHATVRGTICGALSDPGGEVRLYCYDRDSNRFELHAAFSGTGPQTAGKPGIAYHAYRAADGTPLDGDAHRGALWLTVTEENTDYDKVRVWISDPISEAFGEELSEAWFPSGRGSGFWHNTWTNVADGSGQAMYDDETLGAMKGLSVRDLSSDTASTQRAVRFAPFADGSFATALRDGNDFRVMERGICRGLASAATCGPSTWGLN
ncbi:MAG: hypothetical protein ACE37F_24005 [Nannocystaceae bacterium]|nr:hypothetical protein [bacterium]